MTMYVAVCYTKDGAGRKPDSDHACWVGEDRDALIEKASAIVRGWNLNSSARGYHLLVGELTHRVKFPIRYELVKIEGEN